MPASVVGRDGTPKGIGVAVDVFRGACKGQRRAELQRSLNESSREGVVDDNGDVELTGLW